MKFKYFILIALVIFTGLAIFDNAYAGFGCTAGGACYGACGGSQTYDNACCDPYPCGGWQTPSWDQSYLPGLNCGNSCADTNGCITDSICCQTWCGSWTGHVCPTTGCSVPAGECVPSKSSDNTCWCTTSKVANAQTPPGLNIECCTSGKMSINERGTNPSYCCSNATSGDTCDGSLHYNDPTHTGNCWYYSCITGDCVPTFFADKYYTDATYQTTDAADAKHPVKWLKISYESSTATGTAGTISVQASTDSGTSWSSYVSTSGTWADISSSPASSKLRFAALLGSSSDQLSTPTLTKLSAISSPRIQTVSIVARESMCEEVDKTDLACTLPASPTISNCADNNYNGTFTTATLNSYTYSESNTADNFGSDLTTTYCANVVYYVNGIACTSNSQCRSQCCSSTDGVTPGTCQENTGVCGYTEGTSCGSSINCASLCCGETSATCCERDLNNPSVCKASTGGGSCVV